MATTTIADKIMEIMIDAADAIEQKFHHSKPKIEDFEICGRHDEVLVVSGTWDWNGIHHQFGRYISMHWSFTFYAPDDRYGKIPEQVKNDKEKLGLYKGVKEFGYEGTKCGILEKK